MSKQVRASINPDLLVWARESIGLNLETAARKIQVNPDRLGNWESGDESPTINQLRKVKASFWYMVGHYIIWYMSRPTSLEMVYPILRVEVRPYHASYPFQRLLGK